MKLVRDTTVMRLTLTVKSEVTRMEISFRFKMMILLFWRSILLSVKRMSSVGPSWVITKHRFYFSLMSNFVRENLTGGISDPSLSIMAEFVIK